MSAVSRTGTCLFAPVGGPPPRWDSSRMSTIELRTQLLALEAERAAAAAWGLAGVPAYINDLEGDIEVWRAAYTSAAVTEIASLRSALSGPQVG